MDFIIDGSRISGTDTQLSGTVTQIGTWDGSTMRNYVNGSLDGTTSKTGSINTSSNNS